MRMQETGMLPNQRDKRYIHTTSDVLVNSVDVQGASGTKKCTVFYSGCSPVYENTGGVIMLEKNNPDKPVHWIHGVNMSWEHPGGDPWSMPLVASAFPTLGEGLAWTKTVKDIMKNVGYKDAGHVKLMPVL